MTRRARPVHQRSRARMALTALACGLTLASGVSAQASARETADELFVEGKALLAAGDYARACPLLEASYHAEPATGALLALALCHERAGKLASAQREYERAASRSREEQRLDREQAARDKALALAPLVSTLTIEHDPALSGLEVALDGSPVAPERLGKALPVDGGEHKVEATASGKRPWSLQLQVAASGDAPRVIIPRLEDSVPAGVAEPREPAIGPSAFARETHRDSPGLSADAWLGLGAIGAGVISVGVGTVLAVQAADEAPAAEACGPGTCTYRAERGIDSGDAALLCFVVGGVLAASGAVIYLVSSPASPDSGSASHGRSLAAHAFALPGAAGAGLRGRF